MVAFTGRCLVHRAEIMQLHGAWDDALREARRAGGRPDAARRPARRSTGRASSIACRASSPRPRRPTATRAAAGPSRSPASRCCGWPRATARRPRPRSAASRPRRPSRLARVRLLPAYVEIMLAAGDADAARAAPARELEQLARALRERLLDARRRARPAARSTSPPATRAPPWPPCAAPAAPGRSSARRTRRRACACWSGSRAARSATRTRPRSSSTRRATSFAELGAAPDVARVDALSGSAAAPAARADAARAAGAAPRRGRRDEQGDRRRAGAQRADGRPPREQHLRQARRVVAHRGDRLRVPARAR